MIRVIRAAVGFAFVLALAPGSVRAQTALQTELARAAGVRPTNKFKGSLLETATYIGSGSFYASGYHNSYASLAVYARPVYDLGTKYALSLQARVYIEQEMTQPDNANNRRLYRVRPVGLVVGEQPAHLRALEDPARRDHAPRSCRCRPRAATSTCCSASAAGRT